MELKFKKIWPALAVSLVAFTTNVSAVDDMQVRNLENRVSALEQRRGANGMINPPAHPVVSNGTDLWLQGEALFMHVTEDGLGYAIETNTGAIASNVGLDGKVQNVSYDWSWGFRLGAGYNLPHDGWDMLVNWTWLRSHETDRDTVESAQVLGQTNSAYINGNYQVTHAKGTSHFHINIVDLELGREFFVSKWVTLRPFVGARGAWISRTFESRFKGQVAGAATLPFDKFEPELQNRFRSGGLRSGLDTQWGLGSGWSIYGQAAASLLYGRHKLHQYQDSKTGTAVSRTLDVHNNWKNVRAMTDLAAGLRWDHLFGDDQYRVRLQLGWEQHLLFGFDKDMNFTASSASTGNTSKFTSNNGDLAISGLALQMRFDF